LRDQCSRSTNPATCNWYARKYCEKGTMTKSSKEAFDTSRKRCNSPIGCVLVKSASS
jgi:hypothetical protein